MTHLLSAADDSSKMNPEELALGLHNTEVTGALHRGMAGGTVGQKAFLEWV